MSCDDQVERAALGDAAQIVEQRQTRGGVGQPDRESERAVDARADLERRAWLLWIEPRDQEKPVGVGEQILKRAGDRPVDVSAAKSQRIAAVRALGDIAEDAVVYRWTPAQSPGPIGRAGGNVGKAGHEVAGLNGLERVVNVGEVGEISRRDLIERHPGFSLRAVRERPHGP